MTENLKPTTVIIDSPNYNDFYLRNNVYCTGQIPPAAPFNLCPDIIQSTLVLNAPDTTLGSQQSWNNVYNSQPQKGHDNYYYVRGRNGGHKRVDAAISMYYTPAQLIPLPITWQNNQLFTGLGKSSVDINAGAGAIGVTQTPFLWDKNAQSADFYTLVSQVVTTDNPNPIPEIDNWLDLSTMLNNLGLGFANSCYVESNDVSWENNFGLQIPASITNPGTMQLCIAAQGFTGNTIALSASNIPNDQSPLNINPVTVNDSSVITIEFQPQAGFSTNLCLQYWNDAGVFPEAGSTLTISINYQCDQTEAFDAGLKGVLNVAHSKHMQAMGMPVKHYVLAGAVTFVVG